MIAFLGWHLWHTRNGAAYNTWSGWLADIALLTLLTGILASLAAWWRKHNCHIHRCWRLQWHAHPGHGHPVCRKHHPYGQGRGGHLKAKNHDPISHAKWPDPSAEPFVQTSTMNSFGSFGAAQVTSSGTVEHEAVVGAPEPEKPKKKRERKPGTEPVTDIATKLKGEDG